MSARDNLFYNNPAQLQRAGFFAECQILPFAGFANDVRAFIKISHNNLLAAMKRKGLLPIND